MAERFGQIDDRGRIRGLLLTALVLALAATAAFLVFYRHENHADVEGTVLQVIPVPLHVKYTHTGEVAGKDAEEDSFYLITRFRLRDRGSAPLFLKDIAQSFTTEDSAAIAGRRIGSNDLERLQSIVPAIKSAILQTGSGPIAPEQKIEKGSTGEGYAIFQYSMPVSVWHRRKDAAITIDFYHQDPVTLAIPKD